MKAFLDRMRRLFSPRDKRKFVLLTLLMAVSALLEMAGIGLLLGAATLFVSPETPAAARVRDALAAFPPGGSPELRIALLIAGIAVLLAAKNLLALAIVRWQSKFIAAKQADIAGRLFAAYLNADAETLAALAPEECFSNLTRIREFCHLVLLPGLQVVADALVIAVLSVTALALFPLVTLGGAAFMLIAAWTVSLLTRRANARLGREHMEKENSELKVRRAGIFGAKTLKCTGSEAFFGAEFTRRHREHAEIYGKLYTLGQIPRLALESASVIAAAGVFCILLLTGTPQTEILVIFAVLTAAIARLLPAISRCHYNLAVIRQNLPYLMLTDQLFTLPQEQLAPSGPAADAGGTIALNAVDFAYRDGTEVFRDLSLELPPLSVTALAGRSGRGKTTLAELLMGLLKAQKGTVTADGVPIANDLAAWRRQIGYVPQSIFILDGTVRENVAFGLPRNAVDETKLRAALDAAQLPDFDPDRPLNENKLSGGQKQRIGIARALYRDVRLLILDEPTSALDAATEKEFGEVLAALRGKVTILLISHRKSTLAAADRVVEL